MDFTVTIFIPGTLTCQKCGLRTGLDGNFFANLYGKYLIALFEYMSYIHQFIPYYLLKITFSYEHSIFSCSLYSFLNTRGGKSI